MSNNQNDESSDGNDDQLNLPDIFKIKQLYESGKSLLPTLNKWRKFAASRYFVEETLVKAFLADLNFDSYGRTNFIDYDAWKKYYPTAGKSVSRNINNKAAEDIVLPYLEIIDFVSQPETKISIDPTIGKHTSTDELKAFTQQALDKFKQEKPKTFDAPILRIANLRKQNNDFVVKLEHSSYFEQVRTNLTLDYLQAGGQTLRAKDYKTQNNLPEFNESMMVNSIGVSGVVFFSRGTRKYLFMKLRKQSEGIFDKQFGTTSGVVLPPKDLNGADLVSYATQEMQREFLNETGLSNDSQNAIAITPVAFTRELARGGKPQFFFVIEIAESLEKSFKKKFRNSIEGLSEFHDNALSNASNYNKPFSPEFATNLYYAFRLFNSQAALPPEPVFL